MQFVWGPRMYISATQTENMEIPAPLQMADIAYNY